MHVSVKQDGFSFSRKPIGNSSFGKSNKTKSFSGFSDSSEKVLAKYLTGLGNRLSSRNSNANEEPNQSCAVSYENLFGKSEEIDADQGTGENLLCEPPIHQSHQDNIFFAPTKASSVPERPEVSQKNIHVVQQQCGEVPKSLFETSSEADQIARLFEDDEEPEYVDHGAASDDSDLAIDMIPWIHVLQEKYPLEMVQDVVHRVSSLFQDVEDFFVSRATSDELVAIKASGQTQMPLRFKDIFLAWFEGVKEGLHEKVELVTKQPTKRLRSGSKEAVPKITPSKAAASFDRKTFIRDTSMALKTHRSWRDIVSEFFPQISLPAHSSSRIVISLDEDIKKFLERECSDEKEYMSGRRMKGIPSYLIDKFVVWFGTEIVSNMIIPQNKRRSNANAVKIEPIAPLLAPTVVNIVSHSLPFMKRNSLSKPAVTVVRSGRKRKKDRLETIDPSAPTTTATTTTAPAATTKAPAATTIAPAATTTAPATVAFPLLPQQQVKEKKQPHLETDPTLTVFCLFKSADGMYLCPKCRFPYQSLTSLDEHIKGCGTIVVMESEVTETSNLPKKVIKKQKKKIKSRQFTESTTTPRQSPVSAPISAFLTPPKSSQKQQETFEYFPERVPVEAFPQDSQNAPNQEHHLVFEYLKHEQNGAVEVDGRKIMGGIEASQPDFFTQQDIFGLDDIEDQEEGQEERRIEDQEEQFEDQEGQVEDQEEGQVEEQEEGQEEDQEEGQEEDQEEGHFAFSPPVDIVELDSSFLSQFAQPNKKSEFFRVEDKVAAAFESSLLVKDALPIVVGAQLEECVEKQLPLSSEIDLSSDMDEDEVEQQYCGSPEW